MLNLGGVPEHFNLPFSANPQGYAWHDVPGGTGALVESLSTGKLHAATLLTEGFAAWHARTSMGMPESPRLLGLFVQSPLRWGVYTGAASDVADVAGLYGKAFAISRKGSGSQLMAYLLAEREGWPSPPRFVEVGSLAGAERALNGGEADGFLWERFMTAPLVAAGKLRLLSEVPTPWPAFVVATTLGAYARHNAELDGILKQANANAERQSADRAALAATVSSTFGLASADATAWAAAIQWANPAASLGTAEEAVDNAEKILRRVGALG